MSETTESKPELAPTEFLCLAKIGRNQVSMSPLPEILNRYTWEKKAGEVGILRVGRVYTMPARFADDDHRTATVIFTPRFVRVHEDAELVARLEAEEGLRLAEEESAKQERNARDYDAMAASLLPYRKIYAKAFASPQRRRLLELMLIDALRRKPGALKGEDTEL